MALERWQEYTVSLGDAYAWPLVALIGLLVFRRQLAALIGRLETLTWGDKQFKFDMKALEADAKRVAPDEGPFHDMGDREWRDLVKLAKQHPRAGILEAWVRLELELKEAVKKLGGTIEDRRPIHSALASLRETSNLPPDFYQVMEEMRQVRNQAVHGLERPLPDASGYMRAASRLVNRLANARARTEIDD